MIPQQTPVKNHWGNNSTTVFDFDFYINDAEQIKVTHTDMSGYVSNPVLGVDYTVNSVGNLNGGNITFPIEGSTYSVLGWNESTNEKELLSIALDLPVEQPAEYSMSGDLNKKNLEYSLDYLTRLIQILYRQISRTTKIAEGSSQSVDEFIAELQSGNNLARKWAEFMSGTVDGNGYSAKYHANEASGYADAAEQQADRAEQYADSAEFGMKWQAVYIANWVADDDKYKLTLSDVPVVNAVYKGSWAAKQQVANVDIKITDSGCEITSLEAFDGFILTATSVLGAYIHDQTVASDEWIIDHNTGHFPCVTLLDENDIVMQGTVQYVSLNRIKATFNEPVIGRAILR